MNASAADLLDTGCRRGELLGLLWKDVRLKDITCSMSRRGDCYDNAVIESIFASVKKEEAERFPSYSDAKMALFDYIEVFYNQRRRHSTLGQISPAALNVARPQPRSRRGARRRPRAINRCSCDRRQPPVDSLRPTMTMI